MNIYNLELEANELKMSKCNVRRLGSADQLRKSNRAMVRRLGALPRLTNSRTAIDEPSRAAP